MHPRALGAPSCGEVAIGTSLPAGTEERQDRFNPQPGPTDQPPPPWNGTGFASEPSPAVTPRNGRCCIPLYASAFGLSCRRVPTRAIVTPVLGPALDQSSRARSERWCGRQVHGTSERRVHRFHEETGVAHLGMRYLDFHANHGYFSAAECAITLHSALATPSLEQDAAHRPRHCRSGHLGGLRSFVKAVPPGVVDPAFSVHQLSAASARVSRETWKDSLPAGPCENTDSDRPRTWNCTACAPRLTPSLRWTAGRSRSITRAPLRTRFRTTRLAAGLT